MRAMLVARLRATAGLLFGDGGKVSGSSEELSGLWGGLGPVARAFLPKRTLPLLWGTTRYLRLHFYRPRLE